MQLENLQVVSLRYLIVLENKIGKTSMGPCHGIAPEQWKQRRVFEGRKRHAPAAVLSSSDKEDVCTRACWPTGSTVPMPSKCNQFLYWIRGTV